ncbi:MAG TPA: ATP-dependent DNA helicase [Mycobacteriales bacterium]|nr:ATP-dependent DNA helicase [Mycobacteriales bacterium]
MTRFRTDPDGDYLRSFFGDRPLTEAQLAIATAPLEPQLVVAGAGSGKTTVIAARVIHAVAHCGLAPSSVLGLTFTTKAAGELATRIRRGLAALSDRRPFDLDEDGLDDAPTVATYHSYAAQLVRDHALRIGREPGATLLTEAMQWQLAVRVARRAAGPFEHLSWTTPYAAKQVVALAGDLSDHLVTPDMVRAEDARVRAEVAAWSKPGAKAAALVGSSQVRDELLDLVEAYSAEKQRLDLIDFGDQVALACRIVAEAPAVADRERDRFRLILLDEYQDTGVSQRVLLAGLFAGAALTAVGDPNQAIYGWRGASASNLSQFATHFSPNREVPVRPLMTTFRCDGAILAAANAVAEPLLASLVRKGRTPLDFPALGARPGAERAGEVVVARHLSAFDEADWLAERIRDVLDAGTPPAEIAVLSRRRADFARLHQAMVRCDIPVEVVGLGGLLAMPEVSDIVAVLSLLADGTANAAAVRLLTGPRWRISVRDLAALGRRAAFITRMRADGAGSEQSEEAADAQRQVEVEVDREVAVAGDVDAALVAATRTVDPVEVPSLLEAADSPGERSGLSPQARERLGRFAAEIRELQILAGQPLVDLISQIIEVTGLAVEVQAGERALAEARLANVHAFLDVAAQFAGLDGEVDLPAFISYLQAADDAEDGLEIGAPSQANTVKLMTVHAAKGLEWDLVAVPGMVAEVFPVDTARSNWVTAPAVLPFPLRGDRGDLPHLGGYDAAQFTSFNDDCKSDTVDEERRLAYVAMTRARHRLLLSSYCWSPTRQKPCKESVFVAEVLAAAGSEVQIDARCDQPADTDLNPLLAVTHDVDWPQPPDADALARRREAAALVDAAPGGPRPGESARSEGDGLWRREADLLLAEARGRQARTIEVAVPARLTTSQIVEIARDEEAFAAGLARPLPTPPIVAARRGSRFHEWVEQLYAVSPLLEPDDLEGADDDQLGDAELALLQASFLAAGWGDRRPVAVEAPFEMVLAGRLIRGRIDAVYRGQPDSSEETYDVIDYKTGVMPTGRAFEAAAVQLAIYRLAWADLAGVDPDRVTAGFLYVRTGELKRPDRLLDRAELAALLVPA